MKVKSLGWVQRGSSWIASSKLGFSYKVFESSGLWILDISKHEYKNTSTHSEYDLAIAAADRHNDEQVVDLLEPENFALGSINLSERMSRMGKSEIILTTRSSYHKIMREAHSVASRKKIPVKTSLMRFLDNDDVIYYAVMVSKKDS